MGRKVAHGVQGSETATERWMEVGAGGVQHSIEYRITQYAADGARVGVRRCV